MQITRKQNALLKKYLKKCIDIVETDISLRCHPTYWSQPFPSTLHAANESDLRLFNKFIYHLFYYRKHIIYIKTICCVVYLLFVGDVDVVFIYGVGSIMAFETSGAIWILTGDCIGAHSL